jgi:hypothetical protein
MGESNILIPFLSTISSTLVKAVFPPWMAARS